MELSLDLNKRCTLLQPDGKYDEGTVYETGKIPVHIFNGLEIDLDEILG
jgi:hypothetical protein